MSWCQMASSKSSRPRGVDMRSVAAEGRSRGRGAGCCRVEVWGFARMPGRPRKGSGRTGYGRGFWQHAWGEAKRTEAAVADGVASKSFEARGRASD